MLIHSLKNSRIYWEKFSRSKNLEILAKHCVEYQRRLNRNFGTKTRKGRKNPFEILAAIFEATLSMKKHKMGSATHLSL